MRQNLWITAIGASVLTLLILASCITLPENSSTPDDVMPLGTPVGTSAQATLAALQIQEKNDADAQAVATAEVMRVDAQATLDSADATLSAARTQDQNAANVIAAQAAATAAIVRADAQATLVAAFSTQSAALTQDAIQQTQVQYNLAMTADMATQNAVATQTQQNANFLAAGTQTAAANLVATQTQSAAATSQSYADLVRQRDEQRQKPITFLWMWCLPIFIVLLAGLTIWGVWRWLKIRQANQRILENPVDKLPAPTAEIIDYQQDRPLPYLEGDVVTGRHQLTKPDDQVRGWLDEVKRKLLSRDKKDEDDHTDN